MQDEKETVDHGRDVTMKGSKMFSFITKCWNPLCMRCQYDCSYCWSEALKDGRLKNSPRYQKLASSGNICYFVEKELNRHFKTGDFVFVEDCGDLCGDWIGDLAIYKILQVIKRSPNAKFLLLTKNPWRYLAFATMIPENCLCGATIETTRSVKPWSKAPAPSNRYQAMKLLQHPHKMICIEPIIDFDPVKFLSWIEEIKPELIVIGYNNYPKSCQLPEPSLAKTKKLIDCLRYEHFNVQTKTLREKIS